MCSERILQCTWPPLSPPFGVALQEATRFVFQETDPVGIVASGTIVRGEGDASSDLDIYVIHEAHFRRRVQRFFSGVAAEIFINPPHAVRAYFSEEHQDGRPLTAHMLATGFVVYSSTPILHELREEARRWLDRPALLSEAEVTRLRYGIATQLEDGADVVSTDGRAATMLLTQAVGSMLEFFCRSRSSRVPRSKELLAVVDGYDAEIGDVATAFFHADTPEERLRFAEALADRTIGVRGFFPWDSGPDPVPPSTA